MDLATFRTTGTRVDLAAACDRLGIDLDYFSGCDRVALWIYQGDCYLEERSIGDFYLKLNRDEWNGPKDVLEATLYFHHFVSECGEPEDRTREALTGLLADYASHYGLPLQSADEMLAETSDWLHSDWLKWFLDAWEDAERRAAGREFGNRA